MEFLAIGSHHDTTCLKSHGIRVGCFLHLIDIAIITKCRNIEEIVIVIVVCGFKLRRYQLERTRIAKTSIEQSFNLRNGNSRKTVARLIGTQTLQYNSSFRIVKHKTAFVLYLQFMVLHKHKSVFCVIPITCRFTTWQAFIYHTILCVILVFIRIFIQAFFLLIHWGQHIT